MTIRTLATKGVSHCDIARLLGETEGAVRYRARRMQAGAVDGRTKQTPLATAVAEAIERWRGQQGEGAVNLAALHDGLVSFEGRQYSVPFAHVRTLVEVRGCATTVQILADNAIVAVHARHTPHRLLIDPTHYEGASTDRVSAPPPLGRIGKRMLELAAEPVMHRALELYARLAEVAR